jgi:hypothetical protein
MHVPNANVVTSSFDRNSGNLQNPSAQPYNNFKIQTLGGNIVQGQINKISVTELMIPYNTPTVVPGVNDTIFARVFSSTGGAAPGLVEISTFRIPAGFYTAAEMAAAIQSSWNTTFPDVSAVLAVGVTTTTNAITFTNTQTYNAGAVNYFIDLSPNVTTGMSSTVQAKAFSYPQLLWTAGFRSLYANNPPADNIVNVNNRGPEIVPTGTPNALVPTGGWPVIVGTPYTGRYTDFIDIVSSSLCQAQYIRDSTTSQATPKRDVIARVYVCNNTATYTADPAGSRPFVIHRMYSNPKNIKFTVDRSIDTIDLSLFDMYGEPLPTSQTFPAQITGIAQLPANCGAADYAITFHVHEPGVEEQNSNVGFHY